MIQYTILTLHMVLYRSVKVVPDTTNQCTICCQSQEYLIQRLVVPDMVYRCTVPGVTDVPSILTHILNVVCPLVTLRGVPGEGLSVLV